MRFRIGLIMPGPSQRTAPGLPERLIGTAHKHTPAEARVRGSIGELNLMERYAGKG